MVNATQPMSVLCSAFPSRPLFKYKSVKHADLWLSSLVAIKCLCACTYPPRGNHFLWVFLVHLSPSLSCWAGCFCFVSQKRSEVISLLKGRKHLRVLCYVNNKCSCLQALVQVVNKLVNYIEINAIGLDLKLRSPCIDSVLPAAACALCRRRLLPGCPARHRRGGGWRSPAARPGKMHGSRCGRQIVPIAPAFLPKAEARGSGAT